MARYVCANLMFSGSGSAELAQVYMAMQFGLSCKGRASARPKSQTKTLRALAPEGIASGAEAQLIL